MAKYLGIDLGTSNTRICRRGRGIVMREASAIVFDAYTSDVLCVGNKAKKLLGKAPREKEVVLPLCGGAIRNYEDACNMLGAFLYSQKARGGLFTAPVCAVSIPAGVTEVEKNAFENVCLEAGAKSVSPLIDEPMAAAVGAGLDIFKGHADMICDIGGGKIQAAAISYKGVTRCESSRIGGDDLDEAIIAYVKSSYNVLIGKQSAEFLKKTIGSAHPDFDRNPVEIRGKNLLTGQASSLLLRSGEMREALGEVLAKLADVIRCTLERCPAEAAADIFDRGLILCGGTALLPGIAKYFEENIGIRTECAKHPSECVIRGIEKIISGRGELIDAVSIKD